MQPLPDNNEALFRIKEGKSQLKGAADRACVYMFLKEKNLSIIMFLNRCSSTLVAANRADKKPLLRY